MTDAAMHLCPAQPDMEATTLLDVISLSASGMTIKWFFAPPSARQRLRVAVERRYTTFAILEEPTKLIAAIPGWPQIASTASFPPLTLCRTPSGRPDSLSSSAIL